MLGKTTSAETNIRKKQSTAIISNFLISKEDLKGNCTHFQPDKEILKALYLNISSLLFPTNCCKFYFLKKIIFMYKATFICTVS